MSYTGGCSCGSVRFAISKNLYLLACHCNECKKRTGSAFGLSVVVETENVENYQGETKTFTRKSESGRPVSYEFCPVCGSTIRWGIEAVPSRSIFAGGNFDDLSQFSVAGEMYIETAMDWSRLGCNLAQVGEPDNEFRAALIEKSK
ncbi:MAG: GFA family protein [Sphingomonadales bacterium]|nr:GFA family protein [Sphingomonadales bacterium]